jgi:hypothetical protein
MSSDRELIREEVLQSPRLHHGSERVSINPVYARHVVQLLLIIL